MAGSRGNGEGSIYQRSSDGRWLGVLTLGYGPNGRLIRKTVSAKTRSEVVKKLKQLQRHLDDGIPLPDATLTVCHNSSIVGMTTCFVTRSPQVRQVTTRESSITTSSRRLVGNWSRICRPPTSTD